MAQFMSDELGIINVFKPADNQDGVDGDSINTAYCSSVMFLLSCGALTGDAVLTVNSGASDGTKTTAETFTYRLAGADQAATGADVYAARATSAGLTLTAGTYDNRVLIIEIDPASLTAGQPYLTLALSNAASVHTSSCIAITKPRYTGATATSVIA